MAWVASALWLVWAVSEASAGVIQITDTPVGRFTNAPTISADGRLLCFDSNANLGGLNPTPRGNVFVYEMVSGRYTRITSDGGWEPVLAGEGRYIVFTSSSSMYTRRNEDESDELFRYDRSTKRFRQLTRDKEGDGSSALASVSGNGKRVAFESSSNLGRSNPDNNAYVYLRRSASHTLSVDPEGDGESHNPAISADGTTVAFVTTSNLTGGNEDGSQELMVYDARGRNLVQATHDTEGDGDSSSPAVSGDGRFVAFVSGSNIAGLNPDFYTGIFLRRRGGFYSLMTSGPFAPFDADLPSLDGDGTWIAFVSGYDVTGGNPDHSLEVFVYNRERRTFFQVTDSATSCFSTSPKITADGSRIAYLSKCNPTGGNPDLGPEVFVADNPGLNLVVHAEGPVNLVVSDPNSGAIDQNISSIPFATYETGDFDGDTITETRVNIPQAIEGQYVIHMLASPGAQASDPVTVDGTLNGINVQLGSGTVATAVAQDLTISHQGFRRRSAKLKPLPGVGSSLTFTASIPHPRAAAGPVSILFTTGVDSQRFDFPPVETYYRGGFKGTVDGFAARVRIRSRADGSMAVRLRAKDGNLSEFLGIDNVSMVMVVQVGPDTDMYNWRFTRSPTSLALSLR